MSIPVDESAALKPPAPVKKFQMQLTDPLRGYLADILTLQLENPEEDDENDSQGGKNIKMITILEKPGAHGRPKAATALIKFLEKSENPLVLNRTTTEQTLTAWINDCVKLGRTELERQLGDAAAGRNSAKEEIAPHIRAWAYLMKAFDESKVETRKTTRYNRVPDELQGTGICLIKCDSAFLPGSIGAGVGKEELEKAKQHIQAVKKDALEKAADEVAAGSVKVRDHLQPTKRVRTDDGSDRKAITAVLTQLVTIKAGKAAEKQGEAKIQFLNQQLAMYVQQWENPRLTPEMKENFEKLITGIQRQLAKLQDPGSPDAAGPCKTPRAPPLSTAARMLASEFTTPPRSSGDRSAPPRPPRCFWSRIRL